MRIVLGLEYSGACFRGWQSQSGRGTVQDALEDALTKIAGRRVTTVAAGRTDAGVHASAQVVHFDVDVERPDTAWVRGVNTYLPKEVAVNWAARIADDFHARFSAEARHYRYYLLNRATRPGAMSGRVGWDFHPLDVDRMAEAAVHLVGRHDFSAFRAAECQASSPTRNLTRASVFAAGEYAVFEFSANAFLHHMIRNMVGCLVHVGKGARPVAWMGELLEQRDRRLAAPTFMPDGLYLAGVDYAPQWGLPSGPVPVFPWERG